MRIVLWHTDGACMFRVYSHNMSLITEHELIISLLLENTGVLISP